MANPVVYWEICGNGDSKLHDFYAHLFDWKISTSSIGDGYGMVETGAGGTSGGIYTESGEARPGVTVYVQVDDLQTYLDKIERMGGKTVHPPSLIPGIGSQAMFTDPDGNTIGLFQPL